jgi:hypothetical protein
VRFSRSAWTRCLLCFRTLRGYPGGNEAAPLITTAGQEGSFRERAQVRRKSTISSPSRLGGEPLPRARAR